jgi:Uma2 family endonuclease
MTTQLYLTPKDHGRQVTLEEFLSARGQEGYKYEIIHGRIEVSPIANLPHEFFRRWLERSFDRYTEQHPEIINWVQAPARVFLPDLEEDDPTAPEPDVACYQGFPLHSRPSELDWADVSPILVAEILSEDTANKDLIRNRRLYLQVSSIREYWILDPRDDGDNPTLLVYRRSGQRWGRLRTIPPGGTYTTPLLPGFSLEVTPHA